MAGSTIVRSGTATTTFAARHLQQLCKHFAHKLPTDFDPTAGQIVFPRGLVRLVAGRDRLEISIETDAAEAAIELGEVVERHLVRFAFREAIAVDWRAADAV